MPEHEQIIEQAGKLVPSKFFDMGQLGSGQVWESEDYCVRFRLTKVEDLPEGYRLPKLVLQIAVDGTSNEKLIADFVDALGKPVEWNSKSPIGDEQFFWECSQEVLPEVSNGVVEKIRSGRYPLN